MSESEQRNAALTPRCTPEAKLLDAMFSGITKEEAKYLKYLLPRMDITGSTGARMHQKGKISVERARELFLKRFPNTTWMLHVLHDGGTKNGR